jgi:hypothetical protein
MTDQCPRDKVIQEVTVDKRKNRRNYRTLWVLLLLAILYAGLLRYLHSLTGIPLLDGGIGIVLALYTCSRPAINAWEWLFLNRLSLGPIASAWSGVGWLALNTLVVLAGWLVLFMGLIRLIGGAT